MNWWSVLPEGEARSSVKGGFSDHSPSHLSFLSRNHFRVKLPGVPPGRVQLAKETLRLLTSPRRVTVMAALPSRVTIPSGSLLSVPQPALPSFFFFPSPPPLSPHLLFPRRLSLGNTGYRLWCIAAFSPSSCVKGAFSELRGISS